MGRKWGGEAARQRAWGRVQASTPRPRRTPEERHAEAVRTEAVRAGFDPCEFDATDTEARIIEDFTGWDPDCRFVRDHPELHVCTNRDGVPVRPGQSCWHEARAQLNEARERHPSSGVLS